MPSGPRSIGVIMDGNRRWAKERSLPTLEGHRAGLEKVFELVGWADEAGIEEVVLYAFSTENWNRPPEEVSYLMTLFEHAFGKHVQRFVDKGTRLRFIGDRSRAGERIQRIMEEAETRTKEGEKGTLAVAFSYGGRAEILSAVNRLLAEGKHEASEEDFKDAMWSAGLLDPDLVLRTGGEQRLSNFLPWQTVYSELFFTDTQWPDFSKEEFERVLSEYAARERRHGK